MELVDFEDGHKGSQNFERRGCEGCAEDAEKKIQKECKKARLVFFASFAKPSRPLRSKKMFARISTPLRKLRIKHIAQPITEQIDRQHRRHEEHRGPQYVAGVLRELHAALGHDVAPSGNV